MSLEAQTNADLEVVVVVNNGSADGSVERMRARFPRFTPSEAGENLGFAEGCNRDTSLGLISESSPNARLRAAPDRAYAARIIGGR